MSKLPIAAAALFVLAGCQRANVKASECQHARDLLQRLAGVKKAEQVAFGEVNAINAECAERFRGKSWDAKCLGANEGARRVWQAASNAYLDAMFEFDDANLFRCFFEDRPTADKLHAEADRILEYKREKVR